MQDEDIPVLTEIHTMPSHGGLRPLVITPELLAELAAKLEPQLLTQISSQIAAQLHSQLNAQLEQTIADGHPGCRVVVYLRRTAEAQAAPGREYFKA